MPRVRVLLAVLLAVAVVGCGGGKVKVTGKVLKGGKPLPATSDSVLVTLVPADSSAKVASIPTYADKSSGEFVAADVPAGKYKITVAWNEPNPQVDKLDGKFNVDNTKIVRQVDGKTPLVIDLDKPEG